MTRDAIAVHPPVPARAGIRVASGLLLRYLLSRTTRARVWRVAAGRRLRPVLANAFPPNQTNTGSVHRGSRCVKTQMLL